VGPGLLPVKPRLREALQRSMDSAFTLFQFTVRCAVDQRWVDPACTCFLHPQTWHGEPKLWPDG
jgi:hypothetical protein